MASLAEIRQQYPQYDDLSDQQLADALYQKFYADMPREQFDAKLGIQPQAQAPNPEHYAQTFGVDPATGIDYSLPFPGNPNFNPDRPQAPNYHFGLSQSDNPNPLPAIASFGNNLAANIPIAGPSLKRMGESVDAFVTGQTPEQVASTNAEMDRQNPGFAEAGKVTGAVAPYAVAAELPVVNQALGFAGPLMQRLFMTAASQAAINTGDNMAHGQSFPQAAGNAVAPTVASLPAALLGPGGAKMTPSRAAAVDMLKREGVPLTGGQATANKKLMYAESQLGGMSAQAFQDTQLKAFTKAALKAAGVSADSAEPEVLRKAYEQAGDRFNSLAMMTKPKIDMQVQNGLINAATEYTQLKGVNAAPVLEDLINRIGTMAAQNGGILKGEQYKTITTDIRKYMEGTSDVELKNALGEIREVLDDAVERSVGGKTLEAWQKLRAQYRNLIVVTDAVSGGGEAALQGLIDPVSLNNAVRNNVGKRSYAKGYGDLNELSRSARLAMPKLPDSGTASRLGAMMGLPAGATTFAVTQSPLATAGTVAATAAPWLAGKAMLSAPGRSILAKGGTTAPAVAARSLAPFLLM